MPRQVLYSMAGLDRKVLNSRRITKIMAPSNPVFNRSFITSFGVDFYKEEQKASQSAFCSFFFEKKRALFGRFMEKV